jgi:lipopolysaccharide export system protein LptA
MKCSKAVTGYFMGLLMVAGGSPVTALPEDREQPIRITADSASRFETTGETHYTGNVELTQGSLRINADRIVVQQPQNGAGVIIATGNPARLKQTPTEQRGPVSASAERIEYRQDLDTVKLVRNARIEQEGAVVTGATIDYEVNAQQVKARAAVSAEDNQRVEVIIPPGALERSSEP